MLLSHGLEKSCAGEDNRLAFNGEDIMYSACSKPLLYILPRNWVYDMSAFIRLEIVKNVTVRPLSPGAYAGFIKGGFM